MNDFGLIYLLDFEDFEKRNEYINKSAFSEYPCGHNSLGLIKEIYLGLIIGYLKEKVGRKEEKSIFL